MPCAFSVCVCVSANQRPYPSHVPPAPKTNTSPAGPAGSPDSPPMFGCAESSQRNGTDAGRKSSTIKRLQFLWAKKGYNEQRYAASLVHGIQHGVWLPRVGQLWLGGSRGTRRKRVDGDSVVIGRIEVAGGIEAAAVGRRSASGAGAPSWVAVSGCKGRVRWVLGSRRTPPVHRSPCRE